MLAADFFHRKFPPGTAGANKIPWYPLSGDARWKTVMFRLTALYLAYGISRYLLVPDTAGMGEWKWTTVLFFHVAFSLTIFVLGFGVAFAAMIPFRRKYRGRFPGFNHAVNIAIPPMAVLCVLIVWVEISDTRFSAAPDTAPPITQPDG